MHRVLLGKMGHIKAKYSVGLIAVTVLTLTFAFMPRVFSDVGNNGGAGSCGSWTYPNDYCVTHGYGWNLFSINSSGPSGGFSSHGSTSWSGVQNKCSGYPYIFVFTVNNSGGGSRGYDYVTGDYPHPSNYNSESTGTIHGYFDMAVAGGGNPGGYTWGVDAGWFCYNDNPPWSVSVTASANKSTAEVGEVITWTHRIVNNGDAKTNAAITWSAKNTGALGSATVSSWTFPSGSAKNAAATQNSTYTVQPADFGKQICRVTTATPSTHKGGSVASAPPACVIISKKPKLQISGGDTVVGRASPSTGVINVNRSILSTGTYASWSEYAAFSPGTSNIATGGAFAATSMQTSWSGVSNTLSFANNTVSPCPADGCFGTLSPRTDLADHYSAQPSGYGSIPAAAFSGNSINLNAISNPGRYYLTTTASPSVSGTLKKGVTVIIVMTNTTGTIIINGDITYVAGSYSSIADLPQLLLLSKNNIQINNTVGIVNAWLYASNTISTCDTPRAVYTDGLAAGGVCDAKKLSINGPVSAAHLQLRRTYGANPSQGGAAATSESMNLRADTLLWAKAQSIKTGELVTVSTRELPPRY